MLSHATRLDRIEAAVDPMHGAPHLVFPRTRYQTDDEAIASYSHARGLTIAEIRANMIAFSWAA